MKITLVLRDKKNALKLSNKTIESFIERIKTDTKDGAVARRRQELKLAGDADSYDHEHPSHLIYPSAKFEKDANDYIAKRLALKDRDDKGCNFTIEPWHVN